MKSSAKKVENNDANRDPITGAPGAHPIGTGLGAAGGGAAGAAVGAAVGGPIGAVVGAAIGGVTGGLAGKGAGEMANPTEDGYWSDHYAASTYGSDGSPYTEYAPAYKYGAESQTRYAGQRFEDVEDKLESGWENAKGTSKLAWSKARSAVRDAWHRVEHAMPGDADNDGR